MYNYVLFDKFSYQKLFNSLGFSVLKMGGQFGFVFWNIGKTDFNKKNIT